MRHVLVALLFTAAFSIGGLNRASDAAGAPEVVIYGILSTIWSDHRDGTHSRALYLLADDGSVTRIVAAAGPETEDAWTALDRRRVVAFGRPSVGEQPTGPSPTLFTRTLRTDPSAATVEPAAAGGPLPYLTILCAFADIPARPHAVPYYERLMSNVEPGMDHFWRELSWGAMTLEGSRVVGWYTLPRPLAAYLDPNGLDYRFNELTQDCTAAADAEVDFSAYRGINLAFNGGDVSASGGQWGGSLDGATRAYGVTWLPPFAHFVSLVAHEMGHSLGINWHSRGPDFMDRKSYCRNSDEWWCLVPHTIAYHKQVLGWIPDNRIATIVWGSTTEVDLRTLGAPARDGMFMVRIPLPDGSGRFYTLEARRPYGYDRHLASQVVAIVEVDERRSEPPYWVAGIAGGATWRRDGVEVCNLGPTADGFRVRIGAGVAIACASTPAEFVTASRLETLVPWARTGETVLFRLTVANGAQVELENVQARIELPPTLRYVVPPVNSTLERAFPPGTRSFEYIYDFFGPGEVQLEHLRASIDGPTGVPRFISVPVSVAWGGETIRTSTKLLVDPYLVFVPVW